MSNALSWVKGNIFEDDEAKIIFNQKIGGVTSTKCAN